MTPQRGLIPHLEVGPRELLATLTGGYLPYEWYTRTACHQMLVTTATTQIIGELRCPECRQRGVG